MPQVNDQTPDQIITALNQGQHFLARRTVGAEDEWVFVKRVGEGVYRWRLETQPAQGFGVGRKSTEQWTRAQLSDWLGRERYQHTSVYDVDDTIMFD